jgi:GGDEF domain-containing protein
MQNPVLIGDTPVQPRASIGIALSGPGQLTADELLSRADAVMCRAKAAPRQTGATGVATYATEPAESEFVVSSAEILDEHVPRTSNVDNT